MLNDCTIVDFTRLLPGPLATQQLALLGAKVIKIEHPKRGDLAKFQPPFVDGLSSLYRMLNFNKEVQELDYESEAGRAEITALIEKADVLIEQFRPGVMDALGFGYEQVKAINPGIVYISLSGYGQNSDLAQAAGHDLNYLAESGLLSLNTDENGKPVIPGFQIADIAGGAYGAVMACLAGLLNKAKTGLGGYFDVGIYQGILPLLTIPGSQYFGGLDPYAMKVLNGDLINYNLYQCADGEWIALGALEMKFWKNFCLLVDKADWIRNNPLELSIHLFPKNEVEVLFREKTQAEWVALAEGQDICLSPVRKLPEVIEKLKAQSQLTEAYLKGDEKVYAFGLPFESKFQTVHTNAQANSKLASESPLITHNP
jgi:crotonobetainyl-CoA:carnitine CoA-transferase CaiB-like acyl-CoA transferase